MAVRHPSDVSAYSEFVAARSASLFRVAYLVIGDYQLAEDLLQESLVRAYVGWPRLHDLTKAEAYTRRIIVTTAISWRRRRSFHERPSTAVHNVPDMPGTDEPSPLSDRDDLWDGLRQLPPRQRAAVVLRFCEDLSEAQTATLMGCSVGTVKKQVHLALHKLRDQLGVDLAPTTDDEEAGTREHLR
jgi:RNA polymerase sigma-70 factor (sigma-E family)